MNTRQFFKARIFAVDFSGNDYGYEVEDELIEVTPYCHIVVLENGSVLPVYNAYVNWEADTEEEQYEDAHTNINDPLIDMFKLGARLEDYRKYFLSYEDLEDPKSFLITSSKQPKLTYEEACKFILECSEKMNGIFWDINNEILDYKLEQDTEFHVTDLGEWIIE